MINALVPIDGSAAALRALAFTLDVLRNCSQAQVHLLNVHAPLIHPWPGKLVSPDMIDAELRAEGEKSSSRSHRLWQRQPASLASRT